MPAYSSIGRILIVARTRKTNYVRIDMRQPIYVSVSIFGNFGNVELFQTTNSGHVLNGGFMFASLPMGAISKTHDSSMHTNTHIKYHVPITGVNGIMDRFI